jgi:hypothetical protein
VISVLKAIKSFDERKVPLSARVTTSSELPTSRLKCAVYDALRLYLSAGNTKTSHQANAW